MCVTARLMFQLRTSAIWRSHIQYVTARLMFQLRTRGKRKRSCFKKEERVGVGADADAVLL